MTFNLSQGFDAKWTEKEADVIELHWSVMNQTFYTEMEYAAVDQIDQHSGTITIKVIQRVATFIQKYVSNNNQVGSSINKKLTIQKY